MQRHPLHLSKRWIRSHNPWKVKSSESTIVCRHRSCPVSPLLGTEGTPLSALTCLGSHSHKILQQTHVQASDVTEEESTRTGPHL